MFYFLFCSFLFSNILDVSVDMMEELDLNSLRSTGLQVGETELPEDNSEEQPEGIRPITFLIWSFVYLIWSFVYLIWSFVYLSLIHI